MGQRPEDRDAIEQPADPGQNFTDAHAREGRRDGTKLTAYFERRIRFRVERFELAGRSPEVKQDAPFRLAESARN